MDVVALYQHGIEYAVAALGTATTPYHIQKLLRQTDNVVFCFDGDEGRQKSGMARIGGLALHSLRMARTSAFSFCPKERIRTATFGKFGREAFEELLEANIASVCFSCSGNCRHV